MQSSRKSELGPISPELALVDPELARAARELLPDSPPPVAVAVARRPLLAERPLSGQEPVPEPVPRRRRLRRALLSSAAGVAALAMLLTLVLDREGPRSRQAQDVKSVAAAVFSPEARPLQTAPGATSTPVNATAQGKIFVWVPSPHAAAYEFQLFQSGEPVFRARVDEARLELPGRWRQQGLPHALLPGSYHWYVWPISRRTNRQSTMPTVSAELVIAEQPR